LLDLDNLEKGAKMKTKLSIILTILLFTATHLHAVPVDKIFTSSGQILPGEEWGNVYIYNNDTIVDMLGGFVDSMATFNASTLNVTGGTVSTLDTLEFSIANISGGYVHGASALDHAVVNFSDNANAVTIGAIGFGTLNMIGGTADNVGANESGTLNLYGGIIEDSLGASRSAVINIYGYGFNYDPTAGSFDGGQLTGFWLDGTPFTTDLYGTETYSHINFIPEPMTFLLFAIGGLLLRKRS
jgi:hypothetical protein